MAHVRQPEPAKISCQSRDWPPCRPPGRLGRAADLRRWPSPLPAAPAFGHRSIAEVLTSAAASLGVPGFENKLNLPAAKRVCVVLADGLGRNLLKQKIAHTPFLRSVLQAGQGKVPVSLDSAFPSTTAASLASFGTGLSAGQHGMVGYDVLDPDQDRVVNMLGNWDAGVDPRRGSRSPPSSNGPPEHVDVTTVSLPAVQHLGHDRGRAPRRPLPHRNHVARPDRSGRRGHGRRRPLADVLLRQ